MGRIWAALGLVVLAGLLFLFLPIMLPQASAMLTKTETQSFNGVTTTQGNMVTLNLRQPVYKERLTSISSVTSSLSGDNPVVESVSADGKQITVSGMISNTQRDLVVAFDVSATEDFVGLDSVVTIVPIIVLIGALGIGISGVVQKRS